MSAIYRSIFSHIQVRLTVPLCARSFFPKRYISHTSTERLQFNLSLYLVADRQAIQDEDKFFSKIIEAVKGGVSCVQLRDQRSDFATAVKTANCLKKMLKSIGIPLMINTPDLIEVARAANADGVYLEQPFSSLEARRLLGKKAIIGTPVKTMNEVLAAEQNYEIDYISVKIFPSKQTNPGEREVWGIEGLNKIRSISRHRIIAIGGINAENAASVYSKIHFNDGIAMTGDLLRGDDPYTLAQKIQAIRSWIKE